MGNWRNVVNARINHPQYYYNWVVTTHPQVVVVQGLPREALGAQLGANENCNPRDSIATVHRKCLGHIFTD